MRAFGLTYHDVIEFEKRATTGFTGPGAEHYKLTPAQFEAHLEALAEAGLDPSKVANAVGTGSQLFLTFDDGGSSAERATAPLLARRDWPGHFFITTSRIGAEGFLSAVQLRGLRNGGHVIGSHSHTHPFLTRLSDDQVREEWARSKAILEAILDAPVAAASVPGGFYSPRVARLAAEVGYRQLFTSEPWPRPRAGPGITVFGRFSIVAGTTPRQVVQLARLAPLAVLRAAGLWQARNLAKGAIGPAYFLLRRLILARRERALAGKVSQARR